MPPTAYAYVESPVGRLLVAMRAGALHTLAFADTARQARTPEAGWHHDEAALAPARRELEEYFAGQRQDFDIPVVTDGTPFQQDVWRALREIPYGTTVSYGELAQRIGRPSAVRAVGLANGANPVAIVVPCHRVIGADGSLTGFGGGLPVKRALLALERGERCLPA